MSTSGNGDGWPDGAWPPEDLPDLPPDWGPVIIPDDAAELAVEAALVRRELRLEARRGHWRRRLGLTPEPGAGGTASIRLPLLLMLIAILATATSLFAVFWSGSASRQAGGRPAGNPATNGAPGRTPGRTLPALELVGETGKPVSLRGLLPAVIILVDGCDCADDVVAAAAAAPAGVTVVALTSGRSVPSPAPRQPPGTVTVPVRAMADPTAELSGFLQSPPRPGAATAVLVGRSGEVVRILPAVTSVEDYRADLPQLVTR